MTDAPEMVYVKKTDRYESNWWCDVTDQFDEDAVEYLRADTVILRTEADAMVAAALEMAAKKQDAAANYWQDSGYPKDEAVHRALAQELRTYAADDQRAALDQMIAVAVTEQRGEDRINAMIDQREAVAEAVEAERKSWEPVAEALWQLLDDMGSDGTCVCLAAKEVAKTAYMKKINGLFQDTIDCLPDAIREEPKESQ